MLIDACKRGSLSEVSSLIEQGANLDYGTVCPKLLLHAEKHGWYAADLKYALLTVICYIPHTT